MKLLISPTSPYARTARLAVSVLALEPHIDMQVVDNRGFDETLLKRNPLGKVPTLILENEEALFDSRTVVEFLYDHAGRRDYLYRAPNKMMGPTKLALAVGLMDCMIAAAIERRNHEQACQNNQWIERQEGKISRALAYLEQDEPCADFSPLPSADQLFLASALGYQDFMQFGDWKDDCPRLAQWLETFSKAVPAFEETKPRVG